LRKAAAVVNRVLAQLALPGISADGLRAFLRPASDAVKELVGIGDSRLAARPKASRRQASTTSRTVGTSASIRRFGDSLADSEVFGHLVPVGVCLLLIAAAVVSSLPAVKPVSAAPRPSAVITSAAAGAGGGDVASVRYGPGDGPAAANYNDIYLGDGSIPNTMQNPGVGTDAKSMLLTYVVQPGDTLNKIAGKFGLAAPTIYWANKPSLPDPSALGVGQQLLIPPIDGLLVKVGAKDTLESLAAKYQISVQDIIDTNNLPDAAVVLGQTLLIPGASGGPMPAAKSVASTSRGGSGLWPVAGYNYISQYYWSGHRAIDIAAAEGTPVVASSGGTVVFAGNRGYTGGGNVIWVEVGTKLYETYNHLSYIGVRVGQRVSGGQVIGRVGHTGEATGPHLHFEVWVTYPWSLGYTSTAVNPCNYLKGC
jgi:murein DD-endopeptidase MepM/ murein hydrolase activator NlpD